MIAITTSSSTSVKPRRLGGGDEGTGFRKKDMTTLLGVKTHKTNETKEKSD
jgi:hypothetical protein